MYIIKAISDPHIPSHEVVPVGLLLLVFGNDFVDETGQHFVLGKRIIGTDLTPRVRHHYEKLDRNEIKKALTNDENTNEWK